MIERPAIRWLLLWLALSLFAYREAAAEEYPATRVWFRCMTAGPSWPAVKARELDRIRRFVRAGAKGAETVDLNDVARLLDQAHGHPVRVKSVQGALCCASLLLMVAKHRLQFRVEEALHVSEAQWTDERQRLIDGLADDVGIERALLQSEHSRLSQTLLRLRADRTVALDPQTVHDLWKASHVSASTWLRAIMRSVRRKRHPAGGRALQTMVAAGVMLKTFDLDDKRAAARLESLRDELVRSKRRPNHSIRVKYLLRIVPDLGFRLVQLAMTADADLWQSTAARKLDDFLFAACVPDDPLYAEHYRAAMELLEQCRHSDSPRSVLTRNTMAPLQQAVFAQLLAIVDVGPATKNAHVEWGTGWFVALLVFGLLHPAWRRGTRALVERAIPRCARLGRIATGIIYWTVCLELMARFIVHNSILFARLAGSDDVYRRLEIAVDFANMTSQRPVMKWHPVLGWVTKGNLRHAFDSGSEINTNAQGIRGTIEYASQPRAGTTRILMLGDSFTFGVEEGDDQTVASCLGRKMPSVEVINMGVAGYGLDQIALFYEQVARRYRASVVVLNFVCLDRSRDEHLYTSAAKPRFRLEDGKLRLEGVPVPEPSEILSAVSMESHLLALTRILTSNHRWDSEVTTDDPTLTAAIVERLWDDIRKNGAQPVVVYLPVAQELEGKAPPQSGSVHDLCRAHNVPFCDVTQAMLDGMNEGTVRQQLRVPYHYTVSEASVASDEIAEFLTREGLIPAGAIRDSGSQSDRAAVP